MKKKLMLLIAFCAIQFSSKAQLNYGQASDKISVYGFVTDIGYGLKAGYSHSFNSQLSIEPAIVYDFGRPYQTKYQSIGVDIGGNYTALEISESMLFNIKFMGSVCYESLANFLPDKVSELNYGGKGGFELILSAGNDLGIGIYGLQGFMAKKTFGTSRFETGITLKLNLN